MVFPIAGGNQSSGDFITNSLALNDGDSPYLQLAHGADGTTKTMTFSWWFKQGNITVNRNFFGHSSVDDAIMIRNDDLFQFIMRNSADGIIKTNRKFRDPSAWYHMVLAIDTTQGTAANRIKLYVNGVQETSFATATYPDQNTDLTGFNTDTDNQFIGRERGGNYFDGYMADINFIDGAAKAPTDFGETNDNGVWIPKKYSGSYGTNGYILEFKQTGTSANAAGIGADTSGNGNHFTPNNLAATDIGIDTPQNNYCTINSIFADDGNNLIAADFSEGNRKMLSTVDGWKFGRGTFLLEAGKWYVEVKATEAGSGQNGRFGLQPSQGGITLGNSDDNDTFEGINVGFDGSNTLLQKLDTGSGSTIFSDFASGNTAMLAIDLDNNKMWIGKEGTWYNNNNASTTLSSSNHDIALPTVSLGWVFGLGMTRNGSDNITFEYNWGNPAHAISSGNADADGHGNFEFAVPDGYLCSKQ